MKGNGVDGATRSRELSEILLTSGGAALAHGASLVGRRPQFAIMVFGVGIEISLKARLAFEHWHLILDDNVKKPVECWDLLRRGALKTVGGDQLIGLLMRVLPRPEAQTLDRSSDTLRKIASLRNKAAHFGVHKDDPEHDVAKLSATLLRSWHALQRVSSLWPTQLRSLRRSAWSGIGPRLKRLDKYLETHAAELVSHLEGVSNSGGAVGPCIHCDLIGISRETRDDKVVQEATCEVCGNESLTVLAACASCKRLVLHGVSDWPLITFVSRCLHCNHQAKSYEVGEVRIYDGPAKPEERISYRHPNCHVCGGTTDVLELMIADSQLVYACFNCKSVWGSNDMATCESCDALWGPFDAQLWLESGCPSCRNTSWCRLG